MSSTQVCYYDGITTEACFAAVTITYEGAAVFTTTAKAFDGITNYYELDNVVSPTTFNALIPATGSGDTYRNMTLVFCIYPNEHIDFGVFFATAGYQFYCAVSDSNGGLIVGGRNYNNSAWYVEVLPSGSPTDGEPLPIGAWHSVMISMFGDNGVSPVVEIMKIWVDGIEVYSGGIDATFDRHPMAWAGNAWVGTGDAYDGLDCYLSYIWCNEEYLDPATYWASFFDVSNKPKDIGADGSTPTGSPPVSYFPNADFTNNAGTGPDWTEVGTVPAAPSSPTD